MRVYRSDTVTTRRSTTCSVSSALYRLSWLRYVLRLRMGKCVSVYLLLMQVSFYAQVDAMRAAEEQARKRSREEGATITARPVNFVQGYVFPNTHTHINMYMSVSITHF